MLGSAWDGFAWVCMASRTLRQNPLMRPEAIVLTSSIT
jgi:hypothetical protein